jgi:hypothetical protein
MLKADDENKIRIVVAEAMAAALQNGNCTCNLSPAAQSELAHLMGMVKDIGHDSYSAGIEILRENNKALGRFRHFTDKIAQKIAWLLIASGVGWLLWLIIEGIRASIRGRYL